MNRTLAKDAAEFINLHVDCSSEAMIQRYKTIYSEAGYTRNDGKVDKHSLTSDYINFYGADFIQQYTDIFLKDKSKFNMLTDWICSLKSQSLLQHILLLKFFGISITQFYEINEGLDLSIILSEKIKAKNNERRNDEKVLEKLQRCYNHGLDKGYKYKELLPSTMFRHIGMNNWETIIGKLPLSLNYLKEICHTQEEADLECCLEIIKEHKEITGDLPSFSQIKDRFVGRNYNKLEDFDQIKHVLPDYLQKKLAG